MTTATVPGWRVKWVFVLPALALAAGALGIAYLWLQPPPPREPPQIPLEGIEREVAEVIELQRKRLAEEPGSGKAWGQLGRSLLANDVHPDISLVCFQEAARLEPKEPRWPHFSAGLLLNQSKRAEAAALLRRAVALGEEAGETNPAPRLLLAETLAGLGRSEEAEKHFRQALALDPDDLRAHFNLGVLALERGELGPCRAHLERCLASPQARKKAAALLATVCARLEDKASAERYSRMAENLPKDLNWSDRFLAENVPFVKRKRERYRVGEQLEAEGKYAEAADLMKGLVEAYPKDHLPHLILGRLYAQMGQFQLGEQYLLKARELAPDKIQAHYLLGLVHFKWGSVLWEKGGREKAKALLERSVRSSRRALALRPDYGFAHMCLGRSLAYLGRRGEALAEAREAVKCNPEYADNHLFLGQMLLEENHLGEARRSLEQARLLAPPKDSRAELALKELSAREAKQGAKKGDGPSRERHGSRSTNFWARRPMMSPV
jgi:tetratricopeptide (TPR) repeat protein